MGTKAIIELNGKRYDAHSGALVNTPTKDKESEPAAAKVTVKRSARTSKPAGKNMDGFIARKPKQGVRAHQPERTQTLMRHIVKKPIINHQKAAHTPPTVKPVPAVVQREETVQQREERAQTIAKSSLISRFGANAVPTVTKKTEPVPVRPAPPHPETAAPAKKHTPPSLHDTQKTSAHDFSQALSRATSHQQPKHAKAKLHHRAARRLGVSPRAVSLASISLTVLLLGGFIAYQNAPNLAMHMAASKAGFQASLPKYQPSGFSMETPIKAAPGLVSINFRSTSDGRNFRIVQRPTDWNSGSLQNDFLTLNNKPYQTYTDKGKTVYIYEGSNATWVNGGIWYQVEGESALNTAQLLHIANSL